MKLKIAFGLTLCCLLVSLGMIISNTSTAQSRSPMISGWPFSVNFVEDPIRMHGLQIVSFSAGLSTAWDNMHTVPSNKRFILTDISTDENVSVHIKLSPTPSYQAELRGKFTDSITHVSYRSGMVFGPNELIQGHAGKTCRVLVSGYYVDL